MDVLEPPGTEGVCESIVEAFVRGWERYLNESQTQDCAQQPRRIAIVDRDVDKASGIHGVRALPKAATEANCMG